MKNKRIKIITSLLSFSLLTSCNADKSGDRFCIISPSTPTPSPVIDNLFDYATTSTIKSNDSLLDGTLALTGFDETLTSDIRKQIEEIHIPEEINGIKLSALDFDNLTTDGTKNNTLFKDFTNLKKIYIPKTICSISVLNRIQYEYKTKYASSPFSNLPSLESIIVDNENEYYYTNGNCLIQNDWTLNETLRTLNGNKTIICGFSDVVIPEEITSIRDFAFFNNKSINSIKISKTVEEILYNSTPSYSFTSAFVGLDNLSLLKSDNSKYISVENSNCLYDSSSPNNIIIAACKDVLVPDVVTDLSLKNMTSVTSVKFNSNITELKSFAFSNTSIEKINIPSFITNINKKAFDYMKQLSSITVNQNPKYVVEEGTNCLYDSSSNTIIVGYKDVTIPSSITSIINAFENNTSITSINIGKNVTSINNATFSYINDERDLKDYFTVILASENKNFELTKYALTKIEANGNKIICALFPDINGHVELPSGIKKIDYSCNSISSTNPEKIKSFTFNQDLEELNTSQFFSNKNKIEELDLPSSLKKFYISNVGSNFLTNMSNLKRLTIGGKNENEYFKIETGCLIQKNGNTDNSDKLIYGFADVIIPDYINQLGAGPFLQASSITSLTLHNHLIDYLDYNTTWNSFVNFNNLYKCKEINYKGTLEEFKKPVGSKGSLYTTILRSFYIKGREEISYSFINKDGSIDGPYTYNQLIQM